MPPTPTGRRLPTTLGLPFLILLLLLLLLPLLSVSATPAQAHPFGPPLQATLVRDGTLLTLTWTGAEDDWMVVGEHTGAFTEVTSGMTGTEVLAASPLVTAYLAERIRVSGTGGAECAQDNLPVRDLIEEGARFGFTCPEGTTEVTVTLDVLTDVNPAYRTVLESDLGDPAQTLFTGADPTHQVRLGASGGDGDERGVVLAGGVAALGGVGALLWLGSRRKARR